MSPEVRISREVRKIFWFISRKVGKSESPEDLIGEGDFFNSREVRKSA